METKTLLDLTLRLFDSVLQFTVNSHIDELKRLQADLDRITIELRHAREEKARLKKRRWLKKK